MKLPKDRATFARHGERLEVIMQEESFRFAVSLLEEDLKERAFLTEPHEKSTREEAYILFAALRELISTFNSLVSIAEQYRSELAIEALENE